MKLAVAGGGTGGHLFPGLAVADLARESADFEDIVFFGSVRGIESKVVPTRGYELVAEDVEGLAGRSPVAALRALVKLGRAVADASGHLRKHEIDVVLGLGGYASASAVLAARLRRIPVVLMEQNHEPGMSNRMLAKVAHRVCTTFEDTERFLPAGRACLTGNPVRRELEKFERDPDAAGLLVFGGSGGARSMNRAVTAALIELGKTQSLPPVLHQTGELSYEETCRSYEEAGLSVDVRPFIDDMAGAYRNARLAICRSGATTIAELEATATPSVLLPFPLAAGDHQTSNARALEAGGAAILVRDDESAAEHLHEIVRRLLGDPEELDSMSAQVANLYRPGAAGAVLDVLRQAVQT